MGFAKRFFIDFTDGVKLDGMNRKLNQSEAMVLSYYQAVLLYLSSKGMNVSELEPKFLTADSRPEHEDY
jgi:hypothetical protein